MFSRNVLGGSWRGTTTPNSRYKAYNADLNHLWFDIHQGHSESSMNERTTQLEPVRLLGLPKSPPKKHGSYLWPERKTLCEHRANALKAEPRHKEKLNSKLSPEAHWAWSQCYPRTSSYESTHFISLELVIGYAQFPIISNWKSITRLTCG